MYYLALLFTCITSLCISSVNADSSSQAEKPSVQTLISAGVANEVYLVRSDSEPHILKIFNRKSLEDLELAESLLQRVRNAGINTPESIIPPTQVGPKVISVLSYINGHHINDSDLPEVAKLMAKLHLIEPAEPSHSPLKDYNRLFESCKNWEYCDKLKEIFTSLDLSYREYLPRGIIHGDFSYTNLLVDQENKLTLIDFDHLRNDILLTDVARCHLFYGFKQNGQIKEGIIREFVSAYDNTRSLKMIELDAFYTHMKLCLMDVALEMYDHMYIKRDLPIDRIDGNPFNACLAPNLIAEEILSIKDKNSLVLDHQAFPVFFFGLSGVGKTTLIHQLAKSSGLFYIPKFTVTRQPREDDDPNYFEYLSVDEFIKIRNRGEFFVWMDQQGTYYGYRLANLTYPNRYPLLNASAYGIDAVSRLKGIKVLIKGDAQKGLELRHNSEIAKTREKVNRVAQEQFFDRDDFIQKMDIIYFNQFGDPQESARQLKRKIFEEMDHAK